MNTTTSLTKVDLPAGAPEWLQLVATYVGQLQYGQVLITVHQGDVIQVESTQKTRLPSRAKK